MSTLEAHVLKLTPFGESDAVVRVLTAEHGVVPAFARGLRRSRKRFPGGLPVFSTVQLEVDPRSAGQLWTARGAQTLAARLPLREQLDALAHASYAAECVLCLVPELAPHYRPIFELLGIYWDHLVDGAATLLALCAFESQLLVAGGVAPVCAACVRCGDDRSTQLCAFDPSAGGALCGPCLRPGSVPASPGGLRLVAALLASPFEASMSVDPTGLPLAEAQFLLVRSLGAAGVYPERSRQFIAQVGAPF